jgi:hypothetical protein
MTTHASLPQNHVAGSVRDVAAAARQERKLRPVVHLIYQLAPSLNDVLSEDDRRLLEEIPIAGGRTPDTDTTNRKLLAWKYYDLMRAAHPDEPRIETLKNVCAVFLGLDYDDVDNFTSGRNRYLRDLRKARKLSARPT